VVKFGYMYGHQKDVLKRYWTTCSKFVNHSRLNKKESLHFDNEYEIHMSSGNYQEKEYRHNLDLLIISH
jgi:hypothetical protein